MFSDSQLKSALTHYFGYRSFRPGQLATLRFVMAGQDTLAVLPTGAGKSLLYQLPACLLDGTIVVVSPLISLMQDQENRLRLRGEKHVVVLSSLLSKREKTDVLRRLTTFHFIFVSPEMLNTVPVLKGLQRARIALFVIDEAHCISQWGPDFRPEYLLLGDVLRTLGHPTTLMLTATASAAVADDICHSLHLSDVHRVIRSVNRPNIFLAVEQCQSVQDKRQKLLDYIKSLGPSGVVYFSSRRLASELAQWLSTQFKLTVAAYHAGISAIERYRIQQQFMNGDLDVICATSAFGMGIDKDNIRYVLHYHMPPSLTSYVQEIGRAGRDGKQAAAVLLYAPGDEQLALQLQSTDVPSASLMKAYLHRQIKASDLGRDGDVISFYLDHGMNPEDIALFFKKRWSNSSQQVWQMLDYVKSETCKRDFLLEAFGENDSSKTLKWCCSIHQPDWLGKMSLPASTSKKELKSGALDWQERLKKLFF